MEKNKTYPFEQLVTMRLNLTADDASKLIFFLESLKETYDKLREENPDIDNSETTFHEPMEVDVADFLSMHEWGGQLMDLVNSTVFRALIGSNVIPDSKANNGYCYSEENGLQAILPNGSLSSAVPEEVYI